MREYIELVESMSYLMLTEGRADFLLKTYGQKLEALWKEIKNTEPAEIRAMIDGQQGDDDASKVINFLLTIDPTNNKMYSQWLVNRFLKNEFKLEDGERIKGDLAIFTRAKAQLPVESRDINKIKSMNDLFNLIAPFQNNEPQSQRALDRSIDAKMKEQAKIIYDGNDYRILIPLTKEASCYFGVNTRWCTAATNGTNFFDSYNQKGPLYIILDKANNRRWQFQVESRSFMDENDSPIDLKNFLEDHPKVDEVFNNMASQKPIFKYLNGFVFKTTDTMYQVKDRAGLLGQVFITILVDENNKFFSVDTKNSGVPLKDLFNKLKIVGDPHGDFVADNLLYRNKSWGYLYDKGKKIISYPNGHQWIGIKIDAPNGVVTYYLSLFENENESLIDCDVVDGVVKIEVDKSRGRDWSQTREQHTMTMKKLYTDISDPLVDILLKVDAIKSISSSESNISPSHFTKESAAKLLEKKPYLATVLMAYEVYGPNNTIKEMVETQLNEVGAEYEEWNGSNLIVEKFKNIKDAIETLGTESAEWFMNVIDGDEFLDIGGPSADSNDIKDLLRHLKPEILLQVGEYFQRTYPDEIEEEFEEFNPSSIEDIMDIHNSVEDDEFQSSADNAVESGRRSGAESEAVKIFKNSVEQAGVIFFNDGKWGNEYVWDVPCAIEATIPQIGNILDDLNGDDFNESWKDYLDIKIDPDEPRYGFTDYDDDAARTDFVDRLHENGIIS